MNLLYISNTRFPSERAHATQVVQMCQAFGDFGHTVTLAVTTRATIILDKWQEYYGVDPSFRLQRLYTPDTNRFHLGRFAFIFAIVLFAISAFVTIKKNQSKYDVVYSRDEWVLYVLSFLMPRQHFVYESHEAKYTYPVRCILKKKKIDMVVISEGVRDAYLSVGVQPEKMCVAHDGIDASFFDALPSKNDVRKKLSIPQEATIAMYIGGFDAWKGVDVFFEAAQYIDDVDLYVIGGSLSQVEVYQKKFPRVTFLGSRPYTELAYNQQAADVLVIPNTATNTLSSLYTSPLKLFAYMSSSVPVVASDVVSITNVVGRKLVTLVQPDDPKSLAEGISKVVSDYEIKKQGAHSLALEAKKYTWSERAKIITKFIKHD